MCYFIREIKVFWIFSVYLLFFVCKVLCFCGMFNSFGCWIVIDVISFKLINIKCFCKIFVNISKIYVRDLSKNV